jgi:hypothetical protein
MRQTGGNHMRCSSLIGAAAFAAAFGLSIGAALAFDDAQYPNLKGQWSRAPVPGAPASPYGPPWDPSKPPALGQQAPLTLEYRAIYEANLADQAAGGQGDWAGATCRAHGLPAMMIVFQPMEIVVLPDTTYFLINDTHLSQRRIFTDGRDWPTQIEPAYQGGYSIGRWIDEDGNGRYTALDFETRGFKGPRVYDASGIPLHHDNQSIVKERLYLDKADPNLLLDEITVIDRALTQPWTVLKSFRRNPSPQPVWYEYVCAAGQNHVQIGKELYYLGGDGLLMPAKKNQAPPDLRYFRQSAR